MKKIELLLHHIFIDGFNGMANGMFVTLVIGTFLQEIGSLLGGTDGNLLHEIGVAATCATSIGIGIGVAVIYQESMLVVLSSMIAAFIGGNATAILNGELVQNGSLVLQGSGEPLGAFLAALFACFAGHLLSKKTNFDYLLTPTISICLGSVIGLLASPKITRLLAQIGRLITWGNSKQLLLMSLIIAMVVGIASVMPISAVALCVLMNLQGYSAGAATVGVCSMMIGLTVAGFADNGIESIFTTMFGTPKLQLANAMRHPQICIPGLVAGGLCAPLAVVLGGLQNTAVGAGMGCCAFAGQLSTFQAMAATGEDGRITLFKILLFHFVLPFLISGIIATSMRRCNMIPGGIMKIKDTAA